MTTSVRAPADAIDAPAADRLDGEEYVIGPRVVHVPDAERLHRAAPRATRPWFARGAAAASVCALVATLALPLVQQPGSTDVAAAEQRLFSEVSVDDLPSSLAEIDVVDTDAPSAVGYTYRARSVVNYPFAAPVALTDPFGYRTAPVEQFHDAQDFAAAAGTEILAIADGIVSEAGEATDGCGFALTIDHEIDDSEVTSRYCHMQTDSHAWEVGDRIAMGDLVGRVGSTGISFGAHLHLAIRVDDTPVDPMPFLAKYYRTDRTEPISDGNADPAEENAAD
ncbi:M23 family metallopeptidase [Leucobacter sp. USCH14]|uniref:M23 family metallopeptidase n=1 Tax=Leucobacter sp. USCH14 TaxID=3024838 RepID=UPI0030A0DF96